MKKPMILVFLAFIAWAAVPASCFSGTEPAIETQIQGLDARQALALANQWHWERQPVKTYVTTKEVVFQFQSGETRKVALPEHEMVVAIAPYADRTHP
ncbi:MAG: hypothetical protein HY788_15865 [Deltaproteobacteria bacterium]|nr:hypothetical protein [Deltaproteobacteria bacterium]